LSQVVIVIIVHKAQPDRFEEISLTQCYRVLGKHPIFYICPDGLETNSYLELIPNAQVKHIDPQWQKDYRSFNRLKISPLLYKMFSEYEYILFYEPDAFVFRDELEYWCNQGYDYIGAPWFAEDSDGNASLDFYGVGNGGFSIRKVSSHLRVLESYAKVYANTELLERFQNLNFKGKLVKAIPYLGYSLGIRNNTWSNFNTFQENEDRFWGHYVPEIFEWFNIPTPIHAITFSFEQNPSILFGHNQEKLPFGCHAWPRYETKFWRPFIEQFGYQLNIDEGN
jgi:hypothetical protein